MAGHSHSANIAIRKGKQDRLRAKAFSKLSKNIMIAARGGPDPSFNFALRHAIDQARSQSMPNDKIDHATKKGAGLLEGIHIEEIMYEAYGRGGVAVLIETVTDKPTRTRPEITNLLEKGGAKIAGTNAVQFMFQRKGVFLIDVEKVTEEKLMDLVLEAGADDMSTIGEVHEVICSLENFDTVRKALADAEIETTVGELKYLPDNEVEVDLETAGKILKLIDKLEENDDVNNVHTNMKYTDEVVALLNAG